jgi:hypothetical protein
MARTVFASPGSWKSAGEYILVKVEVKLVILRRKIHGKA